MKKSHPTGRAFRKLTTAVEMILHYHSVILVSISMKLQELSDTLGVDVSLSSICVFLKKSGFIRQKLRVTAIQCRDKMAGIYCDRQEMP